MPRGFFRELLIWLPVLVLLAGAANHCWQVQRHQLSPWLGGGFGMFSTSDVGSARLVVITAVTRGGQEHPVTLGEPLQEIMHRARGLPDRTRLEALALATRDALNDAGSGLAGAELAALRIEVWRTWYEPGTLRPQQSPIAREQFEFDPIDG